MVITTITTTCLIVYVLVFWEVLDALPAPPMFILWLFGVPFKTVGLTPGLLGSLTYNVGMESVGI